ncbi:putative Prophage antirepressor [uncultured Pleomorphomonas sp.]|uniref:Putative Prophage antirepressor n=1 Tax=uncultured Pleomorphomonas sp. TaxID=442121 RepID=A0A212L722_9HYPH|nr:Bro-N domain-containing protein [uncultured Pleomorphomonas sp.]SCM73363.1 putative Prophage antirepressor [uncultured Pleomorphomonas sp.]
MTALMNFEFEGSSIRIVEVEKEPWFVGRDVCRILELENESRAMSRLDEDERRSVSITDPLGKNEQIAIAVSEPGVYRLIFTSRKPAAERFKRWIAHDVLPAIRKFGSYTAPRKHKKLARPAQDLRPEEVVAWSSAARCVERIHGRKAAAAFWAQTPLPQVGVGGDVDVEPLNELSARDCLKHLFRISAAPRESVSDLYQSALTDPSARNRLEKCGLMLGLRDWPDYLVVAANHPFLADAFEATDFAWAWCGALRMLQGARKVTREIAIDGKLTPGIAIPMSVIAGLL